MAVLAPPVLARPCPSAAGIWDEVKDGTRSPQSCSLNTDMLLRHTSKSTEVRRSDVPDLSPTETCVNLRLSLGQDEDMADPRASGRLHFDRQ